MIPKANQRPILEIAFENAIRYSCAPEKSVTRILMDSFARMGGGDTAWGNAVSLLMREKPL